jgi:hypothetical protein
MIQSPSTPGARGSDARAQYAKEEPMRPKKKTQAEKAEPVQEGPLHVGIVHETRRSLTLTEEEIREALEQWAIQNYGFGSATIFSFDYDDSGVSFRAYEVTKEPTK